MQVFIENERVAAFLQQSQLRAGSSWINAHNVFVHGVPYGGVGLSGLGGGVLSETTYFDYLRTLSVVRPL
jgi:acyl-CoA reductase-like NAD-dependent aldehyde dehydrogenase